MEFLFYHYCWYVDINRAPVVRYLLYDTVKDEKNIPMNILGKG